MKSILAMSNKQKPSVLIVDDSTTNQVLLEALLQEEGYDTITAYSAKEAFRLLEKQLPDLILLDLLMPQINGFEFLTQVKANPNTINIPIVIVSAVGTKENIETCRELGAMDFFSKPIDIPIFLAKMKEYLA